MGYFLLKFRKFLIFLFISKFCLSDTVICTTSIISSVIKDIGKDKIKVKTIVPPGICPGHADIKVDDLKMIEKEGFLFAQGFEPYLEKIKNSVKNRNFKIILIKTEGNSLIPENQKFIYRKVVEELILLFPEHKDFFLKNLKNAEKEIEEIEFKIRVSSEKLKGKKAICNNHIKEVVEYFGFEVVDVYGRKEELTPVKIKEIIDKCKNKKVDIVVDNLQAGPDTGKVFSEEIKLPHVTISNFPSALPETETLRETLYKDFKLIIDALEKWKK